MSSRVVFCTLGFLVFLAISLPTMAGLNPSDRHTLLSTTPCVQILRDNLSVPSQPAQRYLTLLNLGLRNFNVERSPFLENLQAALESDRPVNPFLNLRTFQGSALAQAAEIVISDIEPEWLLLKDWIRGWIREAQQVSDSKQRDVQNTQTVVIYERLRFDWEQIAFGYELENFSGPIFLTQTDTHYFIAGEVDEAGDHYHEVGIFKVSKSDGKVVQVAMIDVQVVEYEINFWVREGFIYGFGKPSSSSGERIFRLDPRTDEIKWSDFEGDQLQKLFRVPQSTKVAAVIFSMGDPQRPSSRFGISGRVVNFDIAKFEIGQTELEFAIQPGELDLWPSQTILSSLVKTSPSEPAIQIGQTILSDGVTLAYAGNSEEILSLRPMYRLGAEFKKAKGRKSSGLMELVITETEIVYTPPSKPAKVAKPGGKVVRAQFKSQHRKDEAYNFGCEPVLGSGLLLCHVSAKDKTLLASEQIVGMWILDPQSFLMRPVDWPSEHGEVPNWKFVRNSKNQLFFQIVWQNSDGFKLWLLDESNAQFKKVLESRRLDDIKDESSGLVDALIDYENISFVGWKTTDSLYIGFERQVSRADR